MRKICHSHSAVPVTTHELYPCPHTPGSSQYTALNRYERTNNLSSSASVARPQPSVSTRKAWAVTCLLMLQLLGFRLALVQRAPLSTH